MERHNRIYTGPLQDFPRDETVPEGCKLVDWKDTEHYRIDMIPQIVYARRDGEEQHIHLLLPVEGGPWIPQKRYPLIVYVQGSGWQRQQIFQKLGNLVRMCEKGYAVALVEYRPSEIAHFPAQMQDVKTAIRFLRKNAAQYRLNTEKVALWGDSSGGHTALLAGITADSGPDTADYEEYSAKVNCIVNWYAPIDMIKMAEGDCIFDHAAPDSIVSLLLGCIAETDPELAKAATPLTYLTPECDVPPILIIHGGRDHMVPFQQSVLLYERLRELGKQVEFIKVLNANHAFNGFHCDEARAAVLEFIERQIGPGVGVE